MGDLGEEGWMLTMMDGTWQQEMDPLSTARVTLILGLTFGIAKKTILRMIGIKKR